jgi:hypothetical protein
MENPLLPPETFTAVFHPPYLSLLAQPHRRRRAVFKGKSAFLTLENTMAHKNPLPKTTPVAVNLKVDKPDGSRILREQGPPVKEKTTESASPINDRRVPSGRHGSGGANPRPRFRCRASPPCFWHNSLTVCPVPGPEGSIAYQPRVQTLGIHPATFFAF